MTDTIIRVEDLSKVYRLGLADSGDENFSTAILNFLKSPVSNFKKYRSLYQFEDVLANPDREDPSVLWALRDVNFEVKEGEIVGVIGMNGAGKSTLLKVLSNITPPTKGRIEINGRVGSLLEVGTGFHPELTGRENIYLNGTILGMRRREIDRKFDEIVDFSGVEDYLDTPVKRYSSGMRVRLAFAVAAHLEPEILVIDEVLAVGDYAFQKKCISKMQDVSEQGRTVLFVSHSMPSVARLCTRAILLNGGRLVKQGTVPEIISSYLSAGGGSTAERQWDEATAPGRGIARLRALRVLDKDHKVSESVEITEPVYVEMEYEVLKAGKVLVPNLHFGNESDVHLFPTIDNDARWNGVERPAGRYKSTVTIPGNLLSEGIVYVTPALIGQEEKKGEFNVQDAVAFHVVDNMRPGNARAGWTRNLEGVMRPYLPWKTEKLD